MTTKRDTTFKLRLSAEERRRLDELADAAGITAAQWVRQQIRSATRATLSTPVFSINTPEAAAVFRKAFEAELSRVLES